MVTEARGKVQKEVGATSGDPACFVHPLSVRHTQQFVLIGRKTSSQLTKVNPVLPCAASNQRSLLSLYVFLPDERTSTWNRMIKVEFVRSTCQFTTTWYTS
jgi:hypothetical protein